MSDHLLNLDGMDISNPHLMRLLRRDRATWTEADYARAIALMRQEADDKQRQADIEGLLVGMSDFRRAS